ncbi:RNAPII transcription regulator C-terminal-domain-containing protein, partial [Pyronema omphalodes]
MKEAALYMHHAERDPAEAKRIAQDTAKRIESKELKLLEVVQSLGEYLTDDDTTVRAKAIGFLAGVLAELGPRSLTRQQVPVITQFLSDRFEDETGLKEIAAALTSMTKMHFFGDSEATLVATEMIKVDLPKHPPSTRFAVLTLLDALMSGYRDSLKDMGDKFITGLADMVGGEKDPRNLMILFSIMKVILVEFDIVRHTELMFDIVYCYFPITFRPPPDDPYGITAQDLKNRLRECIASTRHFAGQVFPSLIEKLDSTSQNVKMDVLHTMKDCALNYGSGTMSTNSSQLWAAVKFEILNATESDDLANEALLVVKAIATSLSTGLTEVPPANTPLTRYLKSIVKECLELLQEPQQKQAKPAGRILATVATASAPAFAFIMQSVMPALLLVYSDAGSIAKQRAMLQVLNQFFDSAVEIYGTWTTVEAAPSIENPLQEHREKLFEIYSQALMGSNKDETSFRQTAMRGLGKLSNIRKFLEESEIGMVVQYLDEIALGAEEKEEVKDEALQNLREISKFKSNLIMQITFPAFMARLPDSEEESKTENKPYLDTLEALAKLSFERPVFEVLLTRLLNKLEVVLNSGSGPEYPCAILRALLYVLQNKPKSSLDDTKAYYNRLIPPLLTKTILPLVSESGSTVLADDSVLDVTGRLLHIITHALDVESQKTVVENTFNLFISNTPSNLVLESSDSVATNFRPLSSDCTPQIAGCTTLLASVLSAVPPAVISLPSLSAFVEQLATLAITPKSPAHRLALLRIISITINKTLSPSDLPAIQNLFSSLLSSINESPTGEKAENHLRILFYITVPLLLRADKAGFSLLTTSLIPLLTTPLGASCARGFQLLLSPSPDLSKENHAILRLLYKQRVFSQVVPLLIDGFKQSDSTSKPNFLIALSNIIRYVPSSIITPELPKLLPLLLQSMDLEDTGVKAATIETLLVTISESADVVKEHLGSVVSRLLKATEAPANPVRVRIMALRCIKAFPTALRRELLLPYKRQVVKMLTGALEDPRRNVRKEAVEARGVWSRLG